MTSVCGNGMLDWCLLVEDCVKCCHASEEANFGPHVLCDIGLFFRVPHSFVGFLQVEVLDAGILRLKKVC